VLLGNVTIDHMYQCQYFRCSFI